jgi:hypothetical protein
MSNLMAVRPAVADDLDLIIHSFLMGFWNTPAVRGMDRDRYFEVVRPRFKVALGSADMRVVVACAADDPSTLLGWAATHKNTLLWAYVRKPMRGTGVLRSMLADQPWPITGYALTGLGSSPPKHMEFRPWVAWSLFAIGPMVPDR